MNPSTDIEISTSTDATIHLLAFEGPLLGPRVLFSITAEDDAIRQNSSTSSQANARGGRRARTTVVRPDASSWTQRSDVPVSPHFRPVGAPGRTRTCDLPLRRRPGSNTVLQPRNSGVLGGPWERFTDNYRVAAPGFSVEELVCRQPACQAPIV